MTNRELTQRVLSLRTKQQEVGRRLEQNHYGNLREYENVCSELRATSRQLDKKLNLGVHYGGN